MTAPAVAGSTVFAPANLFRALADETRLRAVALLHDEGELCVCELTEALAISQPKMSRHLATLREAGLVQARRDGFWIHYRITPGLPAWLMRMLKATCEGLCSEQPFADDRLRLGRMSDRPNRCASAGDDT